MTLKASLKAGDVVGLKSGGPEMTVVYVSVYNVEFPVQCRWFDVEDKCHLEHFPEEALDKVGELAEFLLENITKSANLRNRNSK